MDRIYSVIKINVYSVFYNNHIKPFYNCTVVGEQHVAFHHSSGRCSVRGHRHETGLIHHHIHFYTLMKIYHKIFFNLIQNKKTAFFITISNHGGTQRIFTGQKNESALTERN